MNDFYIIQTDYLSKIKVFFAKKYSIADNMVEIFGYADDYAILSPDAQAIWLGEIEVNKKEITNKDDNVKLKRWNDREVIITKKDYIELKSWDDVEKFIKTRNIELERETKLTSTFIPFNKIIQINKIIG